MKWEELKPVCEGTPAYRWLNQKRQLENCARSKM